MFVMKHYRYYNHRSYVRRDTQSEIGPPGIVQTWHDGKGLFPAYPPLVSWQGVNQAGIMVIHSLTRPVFISIGVTRMILVRPPVLLQI